MLQSNNVRLVNNLLAIAGSLNASAGNSVDPMRNIALTWVASMPETSAKVAHSSKRMWRRYQQSRLRDFAHIQ
jgi:hypothetical protein